MSMPLTDADLGTHSLASELKALLGRLTRRLRESTVSSDITPSQISVLSRLEIGGPATKSELARAEGISPQSMGVIISALEARDLVVGTPDESDGRKTLYLMTGVAMERYGSGRLVKEDWLSRALSEQFSAAEMLKLAECLPLLSRLARAE